MKSTFQEILSLAAREASSEDAPTIPAIAKELLHYDILLALSQSKIADKVVFQGGTALRICYGGQRYSEDLDFVVGDAAEPFILDEVQNILQRQMLDRYGVTTKFLEPASDRVFGGKTTVVKKWTFVLEVPGLNKTQKINIEFCNIPARDTQVVLITPRYGFLPPQYSNIALMVETPNEIMADKVVAVADRPYLKARDIWDIRFLSQKGYTPDIDLISKKAVDYHISNIFTKIDTSLDRLRADDTGDLFIKEMTRFVSPSVVRSMNLEKTPGKSWINHTISIMKNVRDQLDAQSHKDGLIATAEMPTGYNNLYDELEGWTP